MINLHDHVQFNGVLEIIKTRIDEFTSEVTNELENERLEYSEVVICEEIFTAIIVDSGQIFLNLRDSRQIRIRT